MLRVTNLVGFAARRPKVGNDANTVLLVHFNGTHGAAGPYTDVSRAGNEGAGHTLTAGSTAIIDGVTASPLIDGAEVLNTDGNASTGKITFPIHADFDFGNGEYTIEGHVRFTGTAVGYAFAAAPADGILSAAGIQVNYMSGAITGVYRSGSTNYRFSSGSGFNDGNFHHVAWCRDNSAGTAFRLYVDGVQRTVDTVARTVGNAVGSMAIGGLGAYTSGLAYAGKVEELRVDRICRYPAGTTFTPPDRAYGPDAR